MMKTYFNGTMELDLRMNYGEYAVFFRYSDKSYIVAWLPVFEGFQVCWSAGHYDFKDFETACKFAYNKFLKRNKFNK